MPSPSTRVTPRTPATRARATDRPGIRPSAGSIDSWQLTETVTRLRRVLRSSIRSDYPWEALPMAQVEILQRLADEPGLRVTDLARRHRLAANTISNLVQQMVTAGLVARTADSTDRRAVTVALTGAGEQQLHGWLHAHTQRFDDALTALTATDQNAISRALPALARLVRELEDRDREVTEPAAATAHR